MNLRKLLCAISFFLIILVPFLAFLPVRASDLSGYDQKISDFEKQKLEYLQKLEDLKQAKVSLQNEISYYDTQINLAQIQIDETQARLSQAEAQLNILVDQIGKLGEEITGLEASIDRLKGEIAELAVRRYKSSRSGKLEVFLSAASVGDFMNRLKYLSVIEMRDQETVDLLRDTKVKTQQEKDVLDVTRQKVEAVKQEIEVQKSNLESQRLALNNQRAGKESLLRVTQNDEIKYQKMLAEVEAEISAMRKAVGDLSNLKFSRHVEKGEVIGVQGNTGWSTGDHLHFAVYHTPYVFYQDMEDPMPYLSDGRLGWPVQAFCYDWAYQCVDNHSISQPYGVSDISKSLKWYPNDFHDAIDMFGPSGSLIYAAESGDVAYGTDSAGGNYAMIKHANGLITMYWHLR